jgi:polyhydroxyalkanoate synthesis repressor PhaR
MVCSFFNERTNCHVAIYAALQHNQFRFPSRALSREKMKNKAAQPLIVKKYENRRLYNTLTSQYINQEQVAQLVRDGYDVRVVDAANGEDITRLVLAQIVLEDAKTPNSVFPLDVLRQMVVASGKATQDSALRYMKSILEMYQSAYRALPSPLDPFEMMRTRWAPPPAAGPANDVIQHAGDRPARTAEASSEAAKVNELQRRIEELEARLAGPGRGKKPGKTGSRRKS